MERSEKIHDTITVKRCALYSRNKGDGFLLKVINHLWAKIVFYIKAVHGSKEFSIVHCHDLGVLPAGIIIKWLNGNKQSVIYDSHEYQIEMHRKSKWLKPFLKIIESIFIRFADNVISVSDSIANEYVGLYGIAKPKLILLGRAMMIQLS